MNRRYLVLGLSVVLAISLAVPALGGPSNPVAGTSATLAGALKKAKKAKQAADAAQNTANSAQTAANSAQATAADALTRANAAQTSANQANTAATNANNNANTRFNDILQVAGDGSNNGGALTSDSDQSDTATCATGDQVTGGGFRIEGVDASAAATDELQDASVLGATSYGQNYSVAAREDDPGALTDNWRVLAFAYCAST
jgi:hypothetical protein